MDSNLSVESSLGHRQWFQQQRNAKGDIFIPALSTNPNVMSLGEEEKNYRSPGRDGHHTSPMNPGQSCRGVQGKTSGKLGAILRRLSLELRQKMARETGASTSRVLTKRNSLMLQPSGMGGQWKVAK